MHLIEVSKENEMKSDRVLVLQIRYQKEIERLEKENRDLRKNLMLKNGKGGKKRRMKVL